MIDTVIKASGLPATVRSAALSPAPGLPIAEFWYVDVASVRQAAALAAAARADARVSEAYIDSWRPHPDRSNPTDPGFPLQWHLNNTTRPWASTNVVPAWESGITGAGVTVGIIEGGFNELHPDINANYNAAASQPDQGGTTHGTSTAGLVAAVANNGMGGAGVAYAAKVSEMYYGFETTNADAFQFRNDLNSVKSNSWGPSDNATIAPMSSVEFSALQASVSTGRGGKGEVFVWAAGNGGNGLDRVDYDGYASCRHVMAIGAIDNQDRRAPYSEPGSALLLVTTSSYDNAGSGGSGIYTTTGFCSVNTVPSCAPGDYNPTFGGTSAASPIAAGVVALVLQANPALSSRDVQHLLVRTARKCNPSDPGWTQNSAGRWQNYNFGYGAIDAGAAVAMAPTLKSVGPEQSYSSPAAPVGASIPDNTPAGISSVISVPAHFLVEHAEVVLTAPHARLGDLRIVLTSPGGNTSLLADVRPDFTTGYSSFVFTTVRHWDENSDGNWTLNVSDRTAGTTGTFTSWQLRLYGSLDYSCPCDSDHSGVLTVQDIFQFLAAWFAGNPAADFNGNGVTAQDLFDFLACWFGHPAGCE